MLRIIYYMDSNGVEDVLIGDGMRIVKMFNIVRFAALESLINIYRA